MLLLLLLLLVMPQDSLANCLASQTKQDAKMDIKEKLEANERSGGSSYFKGGAGAGLHIYVGTDEIETVDYSVEAKVVIHEYIHVLQQAFLAGLATTTTGVVPLRSDATSTTRFNVINKCGVSSTFGTKHLAALNALPDDMKLLDIPVYVIEIPETGCTGDLDVITEDIFNEIYGSDCPGLETRSDAGNILINENHAFAEGEAEYYALNDYIGPSQSTFDGPAYWTQKLADAKTGCSVRGFVRENFNHFSFFHRSLEIRRPNTGTRKRELFGQRRFELHDRLAHRCEHRRGQQVPGQSNRRDRVFTHALVVLEQGHCVYALNASASVDPSVDLRLVRCLPQRLRILLG